LKKLSPSRRKEVMSRRKQHTSSESSLQVSDPATADWQQLVQQRLPSSLESQAKALGAFVRVRRIGSASLLLRALLCYVLSLSSLQDLSLWSRLVGVTDRAISAQGWHKRLRQSLAWLLWLFGELLAAPPPLWNGPTSQRILLVDGTEVKSLGPKGELWRLHCAYNLLTGCLAWVQVTTRRIGESLSFIPVRPGDILVGDAIYSRARQLVGVDQQGGYSLTRLSPHHLPLYAAGSPTCSSAFQFDVNGWLHTLSPGFYERQELVHFEQTTLPVRVIAIVPPPEKAAALRRKKEQEAKAQGRKLSEQARFLAGFILLVTTLPLPQWPTALVIELYACRWHIEVLFNRIKQVLDLHSLRWETPETAQAMLAVLLVAWLLIEEDLEALRRQLADGEPFAIPLSSWRLAHLALESLQQVVKGWYSQQRLRALLPSIRRLFREHRLRPLLEHRRRSRFHSLLAADADPTSLFDCSGA
jgi:DDE family transposase